MFVVRFDAAEEDTAQHRADMGYLFTVELIIIDMHLSVCVAQETWTIPFEFCYSVNLDL